MTAIPADPTGGSAADTKYTVMTDANGLITVAASAPQLGETISVTR